MFALRRYSCFRLPTAQRLPGTSVLCCRYIHGAPKPDKPFDILFFGRDEFSCVVLDQLYSARDVWSTIELVTQPDMKTGRRGSILSISPLKQLGQELALPVHTIPPDKLSFRTWQPPPHFSTVPLPSSRLLVTASFGRILPNALLKLFAPSRRLNVHPSLLPAYRGAAPIQHALIDGLSETGVCVIEMMEWKRGIDAGEIWGRHTMPIPEGIEFPALCHSLALEGGRLLVSVLRKMIEGQAESVPQAIDASAPRAPLIVANDALVDFSRMTAIDIVRIHRAISHQKPLFTRLKTAKTVQLHALSVYEDPPERLQHHIPESGMGIYHPPTKSLVVRCASDTLLRVEKLKTQDKALIAAKEWWNGVRPEWRCTGANDGAVMFVL